MANYQYLASTPLKQTLFELLNKYYFYIDKASRLYNGSVCFCADEKLSSISVTLK